MFYITPWDQIKIAHLIVDCETELSQLFAQLNHFSLFKKIMCVCVYIHIYRYSGWQCGIVG